MLTAPEKIIFIVLATVCFGASYITFTKMFRVIGLGKDPIDWKKVAQNWKAGLDTFISQKTLFKTRPVVGFIHALVAWGFSLYLFVNFIFLNKFIYKLRMMHNIKLNSHLRIIIF